MGDNGFHALLGGAISRARAKANLSTPEVSERADIDSLRLSMIEDGRAVTEPFELSSIAEALGTSAEYLCHNFRSLSSHLEHKNSILMQVKALRVRSLNAHPQSCAERDTNAWRVGINKR